MSAEHADRGRFLGQADQGDGAVLLEQREVGLECVWRGSCIEDEVEGAGVFLHRGFVGREDDLVGAELDGVVFLLERGGELHGVRAEGMRELESHVAEAAEADDADFLAGADLPMAQRRVGGDAGAEQRRNGGEVEVGGNGMGEALVDDVVVGVAAHGDGAVDAILGGVGERGALGAEMFFAAIAGSAVAAGVDDDADGRYVADLEFC